jgi:hypothetical protein
MILNGSAVACVAVGLGLVLGGCVGKTSRPSPTSPTRNLPSARVAVTVSSVAKAAIAPEKFSYTFKLQLTDSGGVPSAVTKVYFQFDNGFGAEAELTGDLLGQNRRLRANGMLALDLTCIPEWGYFVGNEVFNAAITVSLTDDNGGNHRIAVSIQDLNKL